MNGNVIKKIGKQQMRIHQKEKKKNIYTSNTITPNAVTLIRNKGGDGRA